MKGISLKKTMAFLLSFVLIFTACFTLMSNQAQAAGGDVKFTITADKQELQRGDTVTITVSMSGNETGAGLETKFYYDADMLELMRAENEDIAFGSIFDSMSGRDIADIYSPEPGLINTILVRNEGSIGDGTLFSEQFRVKEDVKGTVALSLDVTTLIDQNLENVGYSVSNDASSLKVVVPSTGISLDQKSLTLAKGAEATLNAALTPADADSTITWSSSNEDVATVDDEGNVTAVDRGTAVITATANGHSASCNVTVNVPLNGITISGDKTTIKKGQTAQLTVAYDPADTTDDKTVTWSSSDETVASVDANGLVTALKDGKTTITAKVGDKSADYEITVQEVKLTGIEIKESTTIHKGEKETLEITYTPADTTDSRTAIWSSSDTEVAAVDGNGTVTAVAPGSAVITAKVGNFEAKCTVTVDAPLKAIEPAEETMEMIKGQTGTISYTLVPADTTDSRAVTFTSSDPSVVTVDGDGNLAAQKAGTAEITLSGANQVTARVNVTVTEIPISAVSLDAYSKVIEKGESAELKAAIEPENNTDDDQTITWTSSDPSLVTVTADSADSTKATVTAVADSKGGTATITASAWNGTKAVCEIRVPKRIESISLPAERDILRGNTMVLDVAFDPADTDDDTTVTWTSSNPAVATVDPATGMITGVKEGTAEITATTKAVSQETGEPFTAVTTVTVMENHLTDELADQLAFDTPDEILKGQNLDLNALFNLRELAAQNQITDTISITWESADENVAAVDQTGYVLGVAEGSTVITATILVTDGSGNEAEYQAEVPVRIKEIPLQSIAFDKVITEMQVGATDVLHVIYNPENTTDLTDVEWTSSDSSVITVENGKLTAKKAGTATITAKVGDKTAACTITVKDATSAVDGQVNGSGHSTGANGNETVSNGVKTGDQSNVVLYFVLIMAGAAAIVTASVRRNRRGNR